MRSSKLPEPTYIPFVPRPTGCRGRNFIDVTGQRFGRLLAVRPMRRPDRDEVSWQCVCDCGAACYVISYQLRSGVTLSCGCLRLEKSIKALRTHGLSSTRTYNIWKSMKGRCANRANQAYINYGGRGITYDRRWEKFANFVADMGQAPDGLEIDRIDNSGNYERGNCRWATSLEQANNKRNNRIVDFRGERLTLAQLARVSTICESTLRLRLKKGWSTEKAATHPLGARS